MADNRERLATPLQYLKAVGPDRANRYARLGLRTVGHLLFHFPRDYQDLSIVLPIAELVEGESVSVRGVVKDLAQRPTRNGNQMLECLIHDQSDRLRATWFNQPYMRKRLRIGARVLFSGVARRTGSLWEMVHPRVQNLTEDATGAAGEILPVYPLTEGLKQSHVRRAVKNALHGYLSAVSEVLPDAFRKTHGLEGIHRAVSQLHFPSDMATWRHARRRLVFQELLVMQLALALRRQQLSQGVAAFPLKTTAQIDARIRRLFPFELTDGQEAAVAEVVGDLAQSVPMNRLLQGDVGCGKTVVAMYAMLVAVANGCQAALMAPTEVLAGQHFHTLGKALAQARVRLALWTGAMTKSQRQETQDAIQAGEVDVVVGTQSLLHGDYQFPRLALVVIDEQHKFGVEQRARLRDAGHAPHYLVMTATPIPRTVALTAYGDLAVTSIRDLPASRRSVKTYLVPEERRAQWWEFFRKQLRAGRQGYVISPRLHADDRQTDGSQSPVGRDDDVAEGDLENHRDLSGQSPESANRVRSLEEVYHALKDGELKGFRLGVIHGKMGSRQKQNAMQRFRDGETQVLLATSVIEVGIDVGNATVMSIESPERFGLAALHQLRGRIGRGAFAGYAGLLCGTLSDAQRERMEAFEKTDSGFTLSELDFQMRGPGDLLGTRQHGLPPLRVADLIADQDVVVQTRKIAQQLVADGQFASTAFAGLREQVMRRYSRRFALGDVG